MIHSFCRYLLLLAGLMTAGLAGAQNNNTVHHQLSVNLEPSKHRLQVVDRITLPSVHRGDLTFSLYRGLTPNLKTTNSNTRLVKTGVRGLRVFYKLTHPEQQFTLEYSGTIQHKLKPYGKAQARGFLDTLGIIDDDGVFLSHSSNWYPQFSAFPTLTFELTVSLPDGWLSVSQGKHQSKPEQNAESWSLSLAQQEIYLIAARFKAYSRQTGPITAQVFLRQADANLANKYLDATEKYLDMYQRLLGPYPYSKFALVENFWETGFGMPSFTLLGSKVIRLPFILNSSYPHEILHNWWGNGVYVDYASGNWSEGLTAYLADHLIKQQQGQGKNYRLQSLQKYRDYAASGRDFPITDFTSRHSSATESVGYGKTLMLFHMLRMKLGDETFKQSLRRFYTDYRLKVASFDDLRQVFEQQSGQNLSLFFEQWVKRTGAPQLKISGARVEQQNDSYQLSFTLQQTQPGKAYQLDIPIALTLQAHNKARQMVLTMNDKQQNYSLQLSARPLRIDIDPAFDVFRKLDIEETPPAFTRLFGSKTLLVVLPSAAKPELKKAWITFAKQMKLMGPEQVNIEWDDRISQLPTDQSVTVLGWNNRFTKQLKKDLARHDIHFNNNSLLIESSSTALKNTSIAVTTRFGEKGQYARALIASDRADALAGLARKLPHYHKYSYLAFSGSEPVNNLKGRWTVANSPLSVLFEPGTASASLQKEKALIEPSSQFDRERMLNIVQKLSHQSLQGRGFATPGLEKSAKLIAQHFQDAGLQPGGDSVNDYFQHFTAHGGDPQKQATLKNVIGILPGQHPVLKNQSVVIGAHYDHLGRGWPDAREENKGKVHPGADDNASGIAVLLELARVLGQSFKPDRTLVFVAFSGEEAGRLGSKHFVQQQRFPVKNTIGMLNLDTVGRLNNKKILVLGAESASEWPHILRGIGFVTGIESSMVREALDASDQISFHEAGVPAIQLFSGAHADYHRPGDSADKIDSEGLLNIARVSQQVIEYLAARETPLNSRLSKPGNTTGKPTPKRQVSLGSIPDFSYEGNGYRLDGVMQGSAADKAGLRKLDIITRINDQEIQGLGDLSKVLKTLQPGQQITISYQRQGRIESTRAILNKK